MAGLISLSLELTKLKNFPQNYIKLEDGRIFLNINVSVNDNSMYGNNVSAYISQTEEERKNKKPRDYVGNGRVIWTDGKIELFEKEKPKEEVKPKTSILDSYDDLPF